MALTSFDNFLYDNKRGRVNSFKFHRIVNVKARMLNVPWWRKLGALQLGERKKEEEEMHANEQKRLANQQNISN